MNKKNYIKPALKAFEVRGTLLSSSVETTVRGNDNQRLDSKSFSGGLIDDESETNENESLY